jgi:hypothetical protein
MGWWWKSEGVKAEEGLQSLSTPDKLETQPEPETIPLSRPRQPLTRDEQAELEFRELFAAMRQSEEEDSRRSRLPPLAPSEGKSTSASPTNPPYANASESITIAPESLYPDEMSCRSAFDYAFFCQSFGGQWVNIYRYGELRSCSEHWNNFWLCMKTRTYPDEKRKEMTRDHYQKKAIKYKTGPSSEDVWEVRREPLKGAFQGDYAALERQIKGNDLANATDPAAT